MIYTHENTRNASVWDVDEKTELYGVKSIDTEAMTVTSCSKPLRVVGDEVETYQIRYRSIYPIFGGYIVPCLFHCYGRLE